MLKFILTNNTCNIISERTLGQHCTYMYIVHDLYCDISGIYQNRYGQGKVNKVRPPLGS